MSENSYSSSLRRGHLLFLSVGMTMTLLILLEVKTVHSFPLTFHSPGASHRLEDEEEGRSRLLSHHQSIKIREPDKSVLRAIALFIGGLLIFSTIVCLCAMYWCMCWTLQCPGILNNMEYLARAASSACNRLGLSSRRRLNSKSKGKRRSFQDLPPSYEFILTHPISRESESHEEDQEIPPPTYTEALREGAGAS